VLANCRHDSLAMLVDSMAMLVCGSFVGVPVLLHALETVPCGRPCSETLQGASLQAAQLYRGTGTGTIVLRGAAAQLYSVTLGAAVQCWVAHWYAVVQWYAFECAHITIMSGPNERDSAVSACFMMTRNLMVELRRTQYRRI
jgi:hypothetical protein